MTKPPKTGNRPPHPPKARTTSPSPALPKGDRGERRTDQVTLAAIAGAHGIGGEVKLKLFTDDLSPYRTFNDGTLTLTSLRATIARFAEIPDRTTAEALRGTALTVPRTALPPLAEGEYYHADLIGLPVVTGDGTAVGKVVDVANFGAGDVIEIERTGGGLFMVPMRPEAVPEWDTDRLVLDAGFAA